jgi:hypothetical protein
MKLDVDDAAELAEMLQFLSQWLARDPARLGDSLTQFVGHPAYGLAQLRDDLSGSSSCSAATTASRSSAHDHLARARLAVTLIAARGSC